MRIKILNLKIKKRYFILILMISFLMLRNFLVNHSSFFFKNKMKTEYGITIFYNEEIDTSKFKDILKNTHNKLLKSKFYNASDRSIFICNNKFLFSFFCPGNVKGLATNLTRKNKIYIAHADIDENLSKSLHRDYNEDLDKLIAHEVVHSFVYDKKFNHVILPWKKEGYSEYIAYGKNIDIKDDLEKYLSNNDKYIKYRIVFGYLIMGKKMTPEKIFATELNFEDVYKELFAQYRVN